MYFRFLFVFCIFLYSAVLCAQEEHAFAFERDDNVQVISGSGDTMAFPWVGGLNAVQFISTDLNDDGNPDLVLFDRLGNRLLTFIDNQSEWKYVPEYQAFFPPVVHWVIMRDYDNDGDDDLFTYTTGGIKVYRNDGQQTPDFVCITDPFLTSLQGSIYTNILTTYADYPGIIDIDHDGDLDILTFWGLGSFVEMHTNRSMEVYGHADSLLFEKTTYCWGRFAESEESNELFLDTCINGQFQPGNEPKHTGSTFLVFDEDYDGDYDLLLGDVDYPTLAFLKNGGSDQEAFMISQQFDFPESFPVFLYSFPCAFLLDVDFDGLKDLIVSTFDPSPDHSEVSENIWMYKNQGSDTQYDFQLQNMDFFQRDMIDLGAGAYPVFYDWNSDGLLDIVTGNYGYTDTCYLDAFYTLHCKYSSSVTLYLNEGTRTTPSFALADGDLFGLSALKEEALFPTVGDVDGDGDDDWVIGTGSGEFIFLRREGPATPPEFEMFPFAFDAINPGKFSAPLLYDLDDDGDMDLISGSRAGKLTFFENTGINGGIPDFAFVTDELGGVDVRELNMSYYGYSTPTLFTAPDGRKILLVGSESGRIFAYDSIAGNTETDFHLLSADLYYLRTGIRTACAAAYLNDDNWPDLIIGNYAGGLTLFRGIWPPSGNNESPDPVAFQVVPNPAASHVSVTLNFGDNLPHFFDVAVFTVHGELVHKETAVYMTGNIDISEWPDGLYVVSASYTNATQSGVLVKKIVVLK